jgi:FkbM family methyltransferase
MNVRLAMGQNTAIARTVVGPLMVDLKDQGVGRPIFLNRNWEQDETRYLVENVTPDSIFIDIGANIGYYTVLASSLVGASGRVHAFEPNRQNFQILEKNLALNRCGNVTLHDCALGETDDMQCLYKSGSNHGDHRLSIFAFEKDRETEMVPVRRLDSFLDALAPGRRIAMKMDVQGFEVHVMRGMKRMLEERDVYLVMAEFCPRLIKLSGDEPGDMLETFKQAGFHPFLLGAGGVAKEVGYPEIIGHMPHWDSVTGPFLNLIFRRSRKRPE